MRLVIRKAERQIYLYAKTLLSLTLYKTDLWRRNTRQLVVRETTVVGCQWIFKGALAGLAIGLLSCSLSIRLILRYSVS